MPYAVTKAAQFQLVKCLAVTVGPKIRVNTVLPGLLLTEWVSHKTVLYSVGQNY
jgi:NAD(P)-dependent dehydrogenase (short-subunit alcohol dehydrogenase family)